MGEAEPDRRTTPAWLQPVALAALVALSIYHLAAFQTAFSGEGSDLLYLGRWKMFTHRETWSAVVEGEAWYDGAWHPFDPQALFPYEWESGPRYARSAFYRSSGRMKKLAAATCGRFPRPVEQVRYHQVSWRRKLGTMDRPADPKRKELIAWTCGVGPTPTTQEDAP